MKQTKRLRGYISSRPIHGNLVPQQLQNLFIRRYCEIRGWTFLLSATEYSMDDCYMMLWGTVRHLKNQGEDGIALYSLHQLPKEASDRKRLYDLVIEEDLEFHCALESLSFSRNHGSPKEIEDILGIESLLKARPFEEVKQWIDQSSETN